MCSLCLVCGSYLKCARVFRLRFFVRWRLVCVCVCVCGVVVCGVLNVFVRV